MKQIITIQGTPIETYDDSVIQLDYKSNILGEIVKSCGEPDRFDEKCLLSLRGETYVGKVLIIIKNFLNIKV